MQANQPDADPPVADEAAAVQAILNNRHLFRRLQFHPLHDVPLLNNRRLFEFLRVSNRATNEAPTEALTDAPTVQMTPREAVLGTLKSIAMDARDPVLFDDFMKAAHSLFPEHNIEGMRSEELKPIPVILGKMGIRSHFETAILLAALQPVSFSPSVGSLALLMETADTFFAAEAPSLFKTFVASEALASCCDIFRVYEHQQFQFSVESFQRFIFEDHKEDPTVDMSTIQWSLIVMRNGVTDEMVDSAKKLDKRAPLNHFSAAIAAQHFHDKLMSDDGVLSMLKIDKSVEDFYVSLLKEAALATANHHEGYTPEEIMKDQRLFEFLEPHKDATFKDQDGQERYYFSARLRNILHQGFQAGSEPMTEGLRINLDNLPFVQAVGCQGPGFDVFMELHGESVVLRCTPISWKDVEVGHILPLWAHSQVAHHPAVVDLEGAFVTDAITGHGDDQFIWVGKVYGKYENVFESVNRAEDNVTQSTGDFYVDMALALATTDARIPYFEHDVQPKFLFGDFGKPVSAEEYIFQKTTEH